MLTKIPQGLYTNFSFLFSNKTRHKNVLSKIFLLFSIFFPVFFWEIPAIFLFNFNAFDANASVILVDYTFLFFKYNPFLALIFLLALVGVGYSEILCKTQLPQRVSEKEKSRIKTNVDRKYTKGLKNEETPYSGFRSLAFIALNNDCCREYVIRWNLPEIYSKEKNFFQFNLHTYICTCVNMYECKKSLFLIFIRKRKYPNFIMTFITEINIRLPLKCLYVHICV